jgi:5-methylcytosine-specific restriction protein A
MPKLPKSKPKPWIPKPAQHMRQVDNSSFYNSKRWRALRNYYIQKHPLCVSCKRNGKIISAEVVDHIKNIISGGSPVDEKNLQSLCHKCHNSKSGREGHQYRKKIKLKNNSR